MIKRRSKVQKRLAKVVMAALLCTNAVQAVWVPSLAEAESASYREETVSKTVTIAYETAAAEGGIVITVLPGLRSYGNVRGVASPNYLYPVNTPEDVNAIATGNYSGYTVNVNWDGAKEPLEVVYGAYSAGGTVTENTVNITGGTVKQVMGAYSAGGTVTENTANITGGKVTGDVVGGMGETVTENTVNLSGGTVQTIYGGIAGYGEAKVNYVTITGGTVTGDVVGGQSWSYSAGVALSAEGNTVKISGGTIGTSESQSIIGGEVKFYPGTANNNTVEISGGTINSTIWGGKSEKGNAEGNTVTISGSPTFAASSGIHGAAAGGDAINNTVNILANNITIGYLIGGEPMGSGTSSGNTLNIAAKGVTTGAVYAFQNMNFYLPSDIANGDTMLTVNGGTATDVKGVTFGVAALSGVDLKKGNTVNLITNSSGLTTDDTLKTVDSATLAKAEFLSANSLTTDNKYELSISKKGEDTIIATVDNVTEQKADEGGSGENGGSGKNEGSGKKAVSIPDVLKSPVETRASVVTMINAGADLLISQGMSNAAEAAAAERTEGDAAAAPKAGGFAPFAAVSFGKLRAQSGSHVDTKGIGMNLGFAREIENKNGKLLIGPVIEYGHGSYDSYQDSGIKADGKSSYWGIGVIAKQTNDNGFYYEGSLRAGRTKSDYNSALRPGLHVNYDSSATYWAAHLGVGKLEDIGHDNTLDYYGKYFYSHTGSDSTYLNGANETANFDAVNSHRIRLGARITHAINEKNNIYGGLAWQYEFSGDARATYSVSGEAPSPSVKGSSGMIELGWQVKPGKSPMTIDLGVTGWVGKQRGITANLQANWTF